MRQTLQYLHPQFFTVKIASFTDLFGELAHFTLPRL
jgi:hypothetical protein